MSDNLRERVALAIKAANQMRLALAGQISFDTAAHAWDAVAEDADAALAEMGKPAPVSVREAARLTDGQLVARCADAWEQAPVGSTWEHRKGGVYVVKGVAVTSDDLTPVVVYQKTTGYGPAFTRPAAEFLDGRFRAIAEGKE